MNRPMIGYLTVLIILISFNSGCAKNAPLSDTQAEERIVETGPILGEAVERAVEETPKDITSEEIIEEEPEEVEPEPIVEEIVAEEQEFELFNPTLTYPDAYNGPLYATWEHASYNDETAYFNNLNRNGINFVIGAFSLAGEQRADALISSDGLGKIIAIAQKYPGRIVPVFSTGVGGAEEKQYVGEKLTSFYRDAAQSSNQIAGNVIKGLGEIETQEWPTPHNSPKIMQLFSLADSHGLFVMFHPLPGQKDAIKNIVETYSGTIFLIHMFPEDFSDERANIIDLLKTHDNLYFSIDADHILYDGQTGLLYKYEAKTLSSAKSSFISDFDSKQNSLLHTAVSRYKPLVDAVPDKVLWGTEASTLYSFEPEVYDRAIKFSRQFLGELNPEHQGMVAYENALRVFGRGVKWDTKISVIDADDWPECTPSQVDQCDEECSSAGTGDSLEREICASVSNCFARFRCIDVMG